MAVQTEAVLELPELDRKVLLLMARGYDDEEIAKQLTVAVPTVCKIIRHFRGHVRQHLQRPSSYNVTRSDMALYVLQHIITREEREAWTNEAEERIKLLRECNLLDEKAYLTACRAAEPQNFGLTFVALARVTGRYNGKLVRQILAPLWQALGCGPIGLRTTFYLVAQREGIQRKSLGAYQVRVSMK